MAVETEQGIYSVTTQTPMTKYVDGGPPQPGIEVRFTIHALGVAGSVWVPGELPDPEQARELIRAFTERAYEVAALHD